MNLLEVSMAIGGASIFTTILGWILGGRAANKANVSITEIEALQNMKTYYRDEIQYVKTSSEEVRQYAESIVKDLEDLREKWVCYKEACEDRNKTP